MIIFQVEIILRYTCGLTLRKYTLYHRLACLSARNTWLPLSIQQVNASLRFKRKRIWCNMPIFCQYWPAYTESCSLPIPVAARSKEWVCVRSLAGIVGSNSARRMDVCLCVLCCQVEVSASGWSLVLRSLAECGVSEWWSWGLDNEDAVAYWGLLRRQKNLLFASMDSPCDQTMHIEAKTSLYKILTDADFSPKGPIQTTPTSLVDTMILGKKPTRCYTMVYWTYNSLNMFRAPLCPSSGARDYTDVHGVWPMTLVLAGCWRGVWL
jgi:hypothetical protein